MFFYYNNMFIFVITSALAIYGFVLFNLINLLERDNSETYDKIGGTIKAMIFIRIIPMFLTLFAILVLISCFFVKRQNG
jgi:hypothetical protein